MSTNLRCTNCQVEINQTMEYCIKCGAPTKDNSKTLLGRVSYIIKFILIFPAGLLVGSLTLLILSESGLPRVLGQSVGLIVWIAFIVFFIFKLNSDRNRNAGILRAVHGESSSSYRNDITKYRLGISLLTHGLSQGYPNDAGHIISNFITGSALSIGLKGGDILLQIDGEDAETLSHKEATEKLGNRSEGQPVSILISRNKTWLPGRDTKVFIIHADMEYN